MSNEFPPRPTLPLTPDQLTHVHTLTAGLSPTQLAWLSGYLWALIEPSAACVQTAPATATESPRITVLTASQTGNAKRLGDQLRDDLISCGRIVNRVEAGDYKIKRLGDESILLLIASTYGEGEPPDEAIALHKFLFSKKAPRLEKLRFAVLGLGDRSYAQFCQLGKDLDARLAELGAKRLLERVDADADFQAAADSWRSQIVAIIKEQLHQTPLASAGAAQSTPQLSSNTAAVKYTREAPLLANLSVNQKITGRHSTKDIHHLEIDVGDSGLRYQPGDALGIWYRNDPALVDEILELTGLDGETPVELSTGQYPLLAALSEHLELTQNTAAIVDNYAKLAADHDLLALVQDPQQLQRYAHCTPLVEMLRQVPTSLSASQLIAILRPLTPRLYSISSSQAEVGNEVHVTVSVVRYQVNGRNYSGGASGYLADRSNEGDELRVFVETNKHFRLPQNPDIPIIMIASGTGIAPFRAFIQERAYNNASGRNWLFFGNPCFVEDFLYQVEWQRYVKEGILTRIDLAWSRDQAHKVYVQDRIKEQAAELWQWISAGAHLYVCGDAIRMARDVEMALLELLRIQGKMDQEAADEYLTNMRAERRYQRDIY